MKILKLDETKCKADRFGMNENAGPDTRDSGTDWGIGKYISLCKYYLSYIDHKWDEPALDMLKKDMPRIKGMRTGTKFYPVLQVIGDNASLRNDVVECLEANGFTKDDYYVFDKDIDADEFDSAVRHLRRTHKFLVFDNVRITGWNPKETIDKWFALDYRSVTVPNASPVAAPDPIFIFICNPKRNNLLKLKDCVEIECGGETRHPRFGRFDESTVGAGNGNMQVRVTYRVQSYIDGRNLDDIKSKFENMRLPNNMEFVELVSVEDADTYEDLIDDWNGL